MQTDGILIAAASPTCTTCRGTAHRPREICSCALRRICREVVSRYHELDHAAAPNTSFESTLTSSTHTTKWNGGHRGTARRAEFMADVIAIARRALEPREFALFRAYHLDGRTWPQCLRVPALRSFARRGPLFHAVYRIERALGRAYFEHRIYPTDCY